MAVVTCVSWVTLMLSEIHRTGLQNKDFSTLEPWYETLSEPKIGQNVYSPIMHRNLLVEFNSHWKYCAISAPIRSRLQNCQMMLIRWNPGFESRCDFETNLSEPQIDQHFTNITPNIDNIILFHNNNNRIPVQEFSVLWMLAATQTLNMKHANVYVCRDSLKTTAKNVSILFTIKQAWISRTFQLNEIYPLFVPLFSIIFWRFLAGLNFLHFISPSVPNQSFKACLRRLATV